MMRVLHLIPSVAGGGAERQLTYLAEGQRRHGVDVHVGIFRGGINFERLEASGAEIHSVPALGNYDPWIIAKIARLIRRVRPTLVQTWLTQMDVAGGAAALAAGSRWIASERSSGAHYPNDMRIWMRRRVGRFAHAVIANSPDGLTFWNRSRARRYVVPNALPLDEIAAVQPAADDFGDAKVILFVGRLDPVKNISNVIRAMVPIMERKDAIALICGTGPLEDEVRRQIVDSGQAERIRLLGFRDDVWSLMKRADVLVAPSWYEGHPNAVLEAIACGCPVVVSDIGAHRAILDPGQAFFTPPDDTRKLAEAIAAALDDPALARARAAGARSRVAEWSIDRISAEYTRIYEELAS